MSGRAKFRFSSLDAADNAARKLLAAGYEVEFDPESAPLAFEVGFDAEDAVTDVSDGAEVDLGSDFDRLERIAAGLGGELETWHVSRFTRFTRSGSSSNEPG